MKSPSEKGFTLLELLVVLVILSLTGSLVFMHVGRGLSGREDRRFVQEFLELARAARRAAVGRGEPTALYISQDERRCWVGGRKGSVAIPEAMLIEGEGIAAAGGDRHAIVFYPDGSSSGGRLVFSIGDRRPHTIRIDMITGLAEVVNADE
ncbi:MAG: GspH/FimT family pseudopilin [Thermodesulfobacteriota bacterium]|nr:GspH/FimT family pseudopilin [Thermodesulfobacteriota bacterium]